MINIIFLCASALCVRLCENGKLIQQAETLYKHHAGISISIKIRKQKNLRRLKIQASSRDTFQTLSWSTSERTLILLTSKRNRISQGMAPICGNKGFATLVTNSPLANKINTRIVIHEIGHMLGALHSNDVTSVMFPFPTIESLNSPLLEQQSINEINVCQGDYD